jgi:hypothetical protein
MATKRVKDVDTMFEDLKAQLTEQVEVRNRTRIEGLEKTIEELKEANRKLCSAVKRVDTEQENFQLMNLLINNIKNKLKDSEDKEAADKIVYSFLECFFEKDFNENTYDTPLWLGCAAQYYSNKETVIELLKILGFYVPQNVEMFRLPQDWTEEELDIVFSTMSKHYVCNNCIYEQNLRWWTPNALWSVKQVCTIPTYTEIPWQFLLRNPNLKKEKYLKKIGEMATKEEYTSGWRYFFKIDKYQELTTKELSLIINNINAAEFVVKDRFKEVIDFLLKHIDLITNEVLLDKLYEKYKDSYSFEVLKCIFKMPMKYIEDYAVSKSDPIDWLKRNRELLTAEQIAQLLKAITESINKEFSI